MHSAAPLPGIMSQRRGFSERMRELITEPISDAGLLERFASQRDEAAFGELVKRHGPQVLKKSSGTRSSQGAVPGPEKSREIGSLLASEEFHKLQLFQDVWATIRASASGSRLLPRIE